MNTLDWTMAQGLGGQPVDGELYRRRAEQEATLRGARGDFHAKCAEAEGLRRALEGEPTPFADPPAETETVLAVAANLLPQLVADLRRKEAIVEAYRIRHGLTRAPMRPNTAQTLLSLAILVFVEAGINAGFFLNAHMAAGPLSALLLSLMISLVNVAVSASAGYFIGRELFYGVQAADHGSRVFRSMRQRALWKFLAFLVAAGWFHLTVGLVRAQESLDGVHHSLSAYWELLTTPEAVFLVLTGLTMSALSFHKGQFAINDPYPGYGERYQAVLAAREALLDLYEGTAEDIEERFAEALAASEDAWKVRRRAIDQHRQAVQACLKARRNLERAVGKAESTLKAQIARIANHHRAARGVDTPVTEAALSHLASFGTYLDGCDPPPFVHPPDLQTHRRELAEAKARALERLAALFADAFKHLPGEKL